MSDRGWVITLALAVEGGLIVAAEVLGWLLSRPPRELFTWDLGGLTWGFAATLPMIAIFLAILRWPIGPFDRIKRFTEEVLRPLLSPCTTMDLLGISILAGVGEEMFFRGVLQGTLEQKLPVWLAVLIASSLFGVMHAVTLTYALFAGIMGAYLSWVWHAADNLLAPVLAHALYDFLALVYLQQQREPPANDLTT